MFSDFMFELFRRDKYRRKLIKAVESGNIDKTRQILSEYAKKLTFEDIGLGFVKAVECDRFDMLKLFSEELIFGKDKRFIGQAFLNVPRNQHNSAIEYLKQKIKAKSRDYREYAMIQELRKGDLIYGTWEDRRRAVGPFCVKTYPTIDVLNAEIFDLNYSKYLGAANAVDPEAQKHAAYLEEHPKYNPNLYLKPRFGFAVSNDSLLGLIRNMDIFDHVIKRSCKGAIMRFIESEEHKRIHFVLGKFKPMEAFSKKERDIKFTNAEFRFIYRQWLNNPEKVDKSIVFWGADLNPMTPTEYFNSFENTIHYKPKSIQRANLLKLKEWKEQNLSLKNLLKEEGERLLAK